MLAAVTRLGYKPNLSARSLAGQRSYALALVYNKDNKAHGSGSAYPSTPGHFDEPGACDQF